MDRDQLRSSYDQVAGAYETTFLDELRGKPRDRQLLGEFAETVGNPVLEVGCGPGQIGAFVRERGRRVVGVDLSARMAALAGRRLDASLCADMRSLPIGTATAGGLVAFYSLIHLPRSGVVEVLREFRRVLRPGGCILLSVHEGTGEIERDEFLGEPVRFTATLFELDELVAACSAAQLEVTLAERRAPYASEAQTFRLYVGARCA